MPASERDRRPSARSMAFARIRDDIITGVLAPGALLSENELARVLGISRQPVREALLLIAQEGLVEVRPQSGTYVALIDADRIREAQFIREAIEVASLSYCHDVSDADAAVLRAHIARQRTAPDRESFFPLDEEFHRALLSLSGHGTAWSAVSAAKAHLDRARYIGMSAARGIGDYVDDHERVVEAIIEGRTDDAVVALREHLRGVFVDLDAIGRRQPELFDGVRSSRTGRAPRR